MERITLYHDGAPVIYHSLEGSTFSIGSHPANDLVLAGDSVRERHLVIQRTEDGKWHAQQVGGALRHGPMADLNQGIKIPVGTFAVSLEPGERRTHNGSRKPGKRLAWVGRSAALLLLKDETLKLAPLRAPALIMGESGTGKELVARGLHQCSGRRYRPFVPVNCGGLTESLLEDTLFGHESGAFTGAQSRKKGVFEQAGRGTVFLDEIGELPLGQQAALLRVLDTQKIQRIGAESPVRVDFRLVTATNRCLKTLVKRKKFRLDLYHRISTLSLNTSALRHRKEDLPLLARHFCKEFSLELGERKLDDSALAKLATHRWPGNVRELKNVLYRSIALSGRKVLSADDIELPRIAPPQKSTNKLYKVPDSQISRLIERYEGNIAAAARSIGVPRTTLRDRIKRID